MRERSRLNVSLPEKVVFNMVGHLVPGPEFEFRQMGAYLLYNSYWVEPQSGKEVACGGQARTGSARGAGVKRRLVQQNACYLYLRAGLISKISLQPAGHP